MLAVLLLPLLPPFTVQVSAATASINLSGLTSASVGSYSGYTVEWIKETKGSAVANACVVTITEPGTYTLTGSMVGSVVVKADCTVVLNNATITAGQKVTVSRNTAEAVYKQPSPYKANTAIGTAALSIQGNAVCTVQLVGTSKITGHSSSTNQFNTAGIYVENTIATTKTNATVTSQTKNLASLIVKGSGTLNVTGGQQSAAIGGNINRATGNITIESGTINATGGDWSAGIGDGDSDKADGTDLVTWSCADPQNTASLATTKGDTDGDGVVDTCQPAVITIKGGTVVAKAGQSTPGIGTSDELSGEGSGKYDGSGIKGRVWNGLSILIDGGTVITVGGANNLTSVGAGKYTVMSPGCITINKGTDQNPTRMIGISLAPGYTVNNSGMVADQNSPDISPASTANVFCFKYPAGMKPGAINFSNVFEPDDAEAAFLNQTLKSSLVNGYTVYGLAVVLPDGTYKVVHDNDPLGEVVLEGGGMIYGDASNAVYSVTLEVQLDNAAWADHGKSYALLAGNTGTNYLTTFAVKNGTYRIYEIDSTSGQAVYVDTGHSAVVASAAAVVTLDYYTVTFQDGDTVLKEQIVPKGHAATAPTSPTKTGHAFTGWDRTFTNVSNTTVVRAGWAANPYTVRFNSNYPAALSLAAETSTQSFVYDEQQLLEANAFAATGYTFKGWAISEVGVYNNPDAEATWQYADKQAVLNLASAKDAVYDLYAVWEANDATVSANITIDYSYIGTLETGEEGPIHLIESTRKPSAPMVLWRTDPDTGDTVRAATQEVAFTGQIAANDAGILQTTGSHTFTGLQATNALGHRYEYHITSAVTNYEAAYVDAARLHVHLAFKPDNFDVPFKIELDGDLAALDDSQRPEEVYVKLVYRYQHAEAWAEADTVEKAVADTTITAGIVSQHGGAADQMDGVYVVAEWDAGQAAYVGSGSVWEQSAKTGESDESFLYDYHIVVVGYGLQDGTAVAAANAGFAASYTDTTTVDPDWDSRATQWVYFDGSAASGVAVATLGVRGYTIEYRYVYEDDSSYPKSYTYGTPVSLPDSVRSHYTFGGWYTADAVDGVFNEETKITGVSATQTGNLTLYARWTPNEYTVIYDEGSKGQSLEDDTFLSSVGLDALPEPAATDTEGVGYVFDGWYADLGFDPSDLVEEIAPEDDRFLTDGTLTLYAKWSPLTYEVAFHKNNVAVAGAGMANQDFTYDDAATALTGNTYAASGFTFMGWSTAPTATAVVYQDAALVSNLTTTPNDVIHLYGVWRVSGLVTVDSTYGENDSNVVNEAERPDTVAVHLMRRLAGLGDFVAVDTQTLTVAKTAQDTVGYGFATNSGAEGLLMAAQDGTLYEYALLVTLGNYETTYDWRPAGSTDSGVFDARLKFAPNNFDVTFEIDATAIYEAQQANIPVKLPEVINLKVMYRGFWRSQYPNAADIDHTLAGQTPEEDAGANPITQHAVTTITGEWKLVGDRYVYTGSDPVWKDQPTGGDTWDYDYHIQLISFGADPDAEEQNALIEYGDWVYYVDGDPGVASGVMTAVLQVGYGITYELDNSSFDAAATPPEAYVFGKGLASEAVPVPSRTGFDFAGWYTQAANAAGKFDENERFTGVSAVSAGSLVLHARWTPAAYNIIYELRDGSNGKTGTLGNDAPHEYTFTKGIDPQDMPQAKPSDAGYLFDGWYSEPDFAEGSLVESIATNQSGDVTLYAKWKPDPDYKGDEGNNNNNENGGNEQPGNGTGDPNTPPTTPGTTDPDNGTGDTGNTGNPDNTENPGTADTPTAGTVEVAFHYNDGRGLYKTVTVAAGSSLGTQMPAAPARAGYTFAGWGTSARAGQAGFFSSTPVSANTAVYALWAAQDATVYFDLNGGEGTPPATQPLHTGDKIENVAPPTRGGYEFAGWNTAPDGSGTMWDFGSMTLTGETTLYATWEKDADWVITTGDTDTDDASDIATDNSRPAQSDAVASGSDEDTVVRLPGGLFGVPTLGVRDTHWALMNLILALLSLACALIFCFTGGQNEQTQTRQAGDETSPKRKKRILTRVLALLVAGVSVIVFLLTESVSLSVAILDGWTILMAALFVCVLLLWLLGRNKKVNRTK